MPIHIFKCWLLNKLLYKRNSFTCKYFAYTQNDLKLFTRYYVSFACIFKANKQNVQIGISPKFIDVPLQQKIYFVVGLTVNYISIYVANKNE